LGDLSPGTSLDGGTDAHREGRGQKRVKLNRYRLEGREDWGCHQLSPSRRERKRHCVVAAEKRGKKEKEKGIRAKREPPRKSGGKHLQTFFPLRVPEKKGWTGSLHVPKKKKKEPSELARLAWLRLLSKKGDGRPVVYEKGQRGKKVVVEICNEEGREGGGRSFSVLSLPPSDLKALVSGKGGKKENPESGVFDQMK